MYCTDPDCPDFQATGVPGEYVDGVVTCPVCGADLVDAIEAAPESSETADPSSHCESEMESVFETSDSSEMQIVKSILSGAEIPFMVQGMEHFKAFRGGSSAMRFNPLAGSVVFVVPAERAEEARILLTETEPDDG